MLVTIRYFFFATGNVLPKDTQIKRVHILSQGKLVNRPGVYHPIDHFILVTKSGSNTKNTYNQTEAERVSGIVRKNMNFLKVTLEKEGGDILAIDYCT